MPTQSTQHTRDLYGMRLALEQATLAANMQEVPVGAVIIAADGKTVLGKAHNRTISNHDPSAHAEILALRQAAHSIQNYRLQGCTVYITLEPCTMCAAAMLHARVARVVYAVLDTKTGAAGSVLNLFTQAQLNHHTTITQLNRDETSTEGQQIQQACAEQLQQFFNQRRREHRQQRQHAAHATLRDDALRTNTQIFASIPTIAALQKHSAWHLAPDTTLEKNKPFWRMHYWDTEKKTNKPTVILLHGYASYGLLWADTTHKLQQLDVRVLVPDMLGFGQSDKPKKPSKHTLAWHTHILQTWLQAVDITHTNTIIVVACDSTCHLLPNIMRQLPQRSPQTHCAIALLPPQIQDPQKNHWRKHCQHKKKFDINALWALDPTEYQSQAWSAPFIDAGHRAALRSSFWADYPTAVIKPLETHQLQCITTPDSGNTLRQWLHKHILEKITTYCI